VIATGGVAFANARIRALRSRLLGPEIRRSTRADIQPSLDLISCYRVVLDSLPTARPVTLALLARQEIENVKLLWRAVGRGHSIARWSPLWRRLGPLATFSFEGARECTSLAQLAEFLHTTPFGEISTLMWRGHRADLLAAELGFDRWMSRRLLDTASSLEASETLARGLIESIVVERDLSVLRRGVATYKLSPDALAGTLAFLPQVMSLEHITSLATWTPGRAAFRGHWPRGWRSTLTGASDWDALLLRWRTARYRLCARAFLEQPFCLAPAVAFLLLAEEEARAVAALRDARGGTIEMPSLRFALAASAVGH
jgi:ATP synthase (C/AC39) subunit